MKNYSYVEVRLAKPLVDVEKREDGTILLRSPRSLDAYATSINEKLSYWASKTPDQIFLAERDAEDQWCRVSYSSAAAKVDSIAQWLLDQGLTAQTPIAVLSHNSINHALMVLGAMRVGVPISSISTAYSLVSKDHAKLKAIIEVLDPELIYVADASQYAGALDDLSLEGRKVVASTNVNSYKGVTPFSTLLDTETSVQVESRSAEVGPDTIAKILFTSGSTGTPKGVVNTQKMLCSTQQALSQVWPFLTDEPPIILDWLPWSHTFGANHNFNMVLFNGGTLYIDDGKPVPGLIQRTIRNLLDVSPTIFFNVPAGYDILLGHLEANEVLRDAFFANVKVIFNAGAALPQHLWERLETLAVVSKGVRIPLLSGYGATETAPSVTSVHYITDSSRIIGVPVPGVTVKLVPNNGKLELRVKGPNVTPGYWCAPEQTQEAFDDEGFYCMGDAACFYDPFDPTKGLSFDGRVAEDFKLLSGTWVHVGNVRVEAISAGAPVIQDAVVTGHDRDEVGLLVFVAEEGCRSLCSHSAAEVPLAQLIQHDEVRVAVKTQLRSYNRTNAGSSMRVARVILMAEPPSVDAGEITDKGYLNQRAILARREALVDHLYSAVEGDPEVLFIDA